MSIKEAPDVYIVGDNGSNLQDIAMGGNNNNNIILSNLKKQVTLLEKKVTQFPTYFSNKVYFKLTAENWTAPRIFLHKYEVESSAENDFNDKQCWEESPYMKYEGNGIYSFPLNDVYDEVIFFCDVINTNTGFNYQTELLKIPPKNLYKSPMFIQNKAGLGGIWGDYSTNQIRLFIQDTSYITASASDESSPNINGCTLYSDNNVYTGYCIGNIRCNLNFNLYSSVKCAYWEIDIPADIDDGNLILEIINYNSESRVETFYTEGFDSLFSLCYGVTTIAFHLDSEFTLFDSLDDPDTYYSWLYGLEDLDILARISSSENKIKELGKKAINYDNIDNKPKINDVQLSGNKSLDELGLYSKGEVDNLISLIPKFDIKVVESLPTEEISGTTLYLVPSTNDEPNMYTEYIYVNDVWEKLGEQTLDLSEYVKSTDYATNSKSGVIKLGGRLDLSDDGVLKGVEMEESEIDSGDPSSLICSGSLKRYVETKVGTKVDEIIANQSVSGSGTLSINSSNGPSDIISSATYYYVKRGELVTLFCSIKFNAGTCNYADFNGLPFNYNNKVGQLRTYAATNKGEMFRIAVSSGMLFIASSTATRTQDEELNFSITYLTNSASPLTLDVYSGGVVE